MQFDPRAGINQQTKAERVAFGKPEVGEGLNLGIDFVGNLPGDAVAGHPGVQGLAQGLDALDAALGAHGAAQQIGILSGATSNGHRHLHELFLKNRNAEGSFERFDELRVQVGDGFLAELAANVGVHGAALNGPGANQGNLHHEVVKPAGLKPRKEPHLRSRFDLEDTDRVGLAEHVKHSGLFFGHQVEVDFFA